MDTYEYKCKSCYNETEKMNIPMKDFDKNIKCPKCGKTAIRIPSLPGLIII